nr:MAG TPA: hypothetical protein [Crassvirales sp.]
MPKLYDKLVASHAEAAAFYPIMGSNNPIGLIIILYKKKKEYKMPYYPVVIGPEISRLAAILDYNNIKKYVNE